MNRYRCLPIYSLILMPKPHIIIVCILVIVHSVFNINTIKTTLFIVIYIYKFQYNITFLSKCTPYIQYIKCIPNKHIGLIYSL